MPNIDPVNATALPRSSRRAALGLFAAASAAVLAFANGAPVVAAPLSGDDPIFDLIERHRAAFKAFCDASSRTDSVKAKNEGREVTEADEVAYEEASEAQMDLAAELIATPPITVAGMRAAIEHLIKYDAGCEPVACGQFLATLLESPVLVGGAANKREMADV